LTVATEQRLHAPLPSLRRQIRDLEFEVGAKLFIPSVCGIELTAAGRVFLDHARLALAQVEAAKAARHAARPEKPTFAIGFLSEQELEWLPEAMRILQDELPKSMSPFPVRIHLHSLTHSLGENSILPSSGQKAGLQISSMNFSNGKRWSS
jgi:DNA-binding transcriptional LysR family regulator